MFDGGLVSHQSLEFLQTVTGIGSIRIRRLNRGCYLGFPIMTIDLAKIEDSTHLLDLLVQMEDILDSQDLYVYRNWLSGEIVEGPVIRRHWVSFSLLYPKNKMPDPRGSLRLLKLNIKVEFSKVSRADGSTPLNPAAGQAGTIPASNEHPTDTHWLVKLTFPRRLLDQMGENTDYYEDDVDTDDVEDAKDSGIDAESAYTSGEQGPEGLGDMGAPTLEDGAPR